jgi:predicted nucleic acid-binding Zn ribbon protein
MPAKKYYKPVMREWRACLVCGRMLKGTVRKVYCSATCRQRAQRKRQAGKSVAHIFGAS